MKERITITLDENLLGELDEERGLVPRSTFIESKLKGAGAAKSGAHP